MTANEEYALRIANGEKLSAILDEVRAVEYQRGWEKGKSRTAKTSGGGDDNE